MKHSTQFTTQKRFGFFVGILSLLAFVVNIMGFIMAGRLSFADILAYWVVLILLAGIGLLTTRKESKLIQLFQVLLLFVVSFMSMLDYKTINDLTGEAMAILGIYMAIQYGFLKKRFYFKMILFMLVLTISKFMIISYKFNIFTPDKVEFVLITRYLGQYALLAATVVLLWLLTKDQIQNYINQGKGIEEKYNQNSVFIDIGKIVWGFLHDLGNLSYSLVDVRMLERQLTSLIQSEEEVSKEKLKVCLEGATRIEKMLSAVDERQEQIKKMIKAKHVISNERIDLNDMIENLVNYIKITCRLRNIHIHLTLSRQKIFLWASPFEILQAVENIVRNSLEAMRENGGTRMSVSTSQEHNKPKIVIADTGGGIKFIEKDGKVGLEEFQIGKTTKEDKGTGWGMYTAINNIRHNSGHLSISTEKGVGTTFEILFDLDGGKND